MMAHCCCHAAPGACVMYVGGLPAAAPTVASWHAALLVCVVDQALFLMLLSDLMQTGT
jgi:hypothetical protein